MNTVRYTFARAGLAVLLGFPIVFATVAHAADTTPSTLDDVPAFKAAREKIKTGDHAAAIPLLASVLKDKPKEADALSLMGFSLRKTGKANEALNYYGRALAVDPKHLGANEYLGELYAELGQIDNARARLAVLETACGKKCEQTEEVAEAIQKASTKR